MKSMGVINDVCSQHWLLLHYSTILSTSSCTALSPTIEWICEHSQSIRGPKGLPKGLPILHRMHQVAGAAGDTVVEPGMVQVLRIRRAAVEGLEVLGGHCKRQGGRLHAMLLCHSGEEALQVAALPPEARTGVRHPTNAGSPCTPLRASPTWWSRFPCCAPATDCWAAA